MTLLGNSKIKLGNIPSESKFTLGFAISQQSHLSRPPPIMNFTDQDRQGFVTLGASFGSIAMGRQMLRCPQHDRTGLDWEKSLLASLCLILLSTSITAPLHFGEPCKTEL